MHIEIILIGIAQQSGDGDPPEYGRVFGTLGIGISLVQLCEYVCVCMCIGISIVELCEYVCVYVL